VEEDKSALYLKEPVEGSLGAFYLRSWLKKTDALVAVLPEELA
jgi:hypothetical protein